MKDKKDKVINLLMKKNKITNKLLEVFLDRDEVLSKEEMRQLDKYTSENSDILKELTKLGYAKEIK